MASVINTNTLSMVTQQNLNQSQNALNTSMERLSSGMRINSAKDDAAGQAIANRMDSQITGLSQAQRNANDGISVAQTAEGALNQVNDNLQRVRELTVQAQNGTNNADDLSSIQDEITMRMDEINRISEQTSFNGVDVLAHNQSLSIQVGANDGESISINLEKIDATTLNLGNFTVAGDKQVTEEQMMVNFGATSSATYTDDTNTFSVDNNGNVTDPANSDAQVLKAGDGSFSSIASSIMTNDTTEVTSGGDWNEVTGYVATTTDGVYTLEVDGETLTATVAQADGTVTITDSEGNTVTDSIHKTDAGGFTTTADVNATADDLDADSNFSSSKSYTISDGDAAGTYNVDSEGVVTDSTNKTMYLSKQTDGTSTLVTEDNAQAATADPLQAIDEALKQVDSMRSDLGAVQNRFDSAITNLATTETNLASAQSRIQDADYAEEVSSMTTAQILQQAGTSMLTQANQVPQSVLSLLG